jgi:mannose-6-phosphate isomerase-like protein (cupin superfamily)
MHIETVRQNWYERGFSCDLWIDPPGQRWEGYGHATDERVMIVAGEVEFEIEGTVYRLDPGQELFIPARAVHSVRNRGKTEARWLYGYSPR